jgi:hypothetical protein
MEKAPDATKPHIAILIPSHDMCSVLFAYDLAKMMAFTTHYMHGQVDMTIHLCPGTYIHKARQELIVEAIQAGADYALWLDSDMRFPKESLVRLATHMSNDPEKKMIGINYSTRGIPPKFVAIKRVTQFDEEGALIHGRALDTWDDSEGLEEVEGIGFGLVLMNLEIVEDFPTDEPWFFYEWSEKTGKLHVGEDIWFCMKVRERGHTIYVDHDLSKECAHVGTMEYHLEHAQDQELTRRAALKELEDGDSDV